MVQCSEEINRKISTKFKLLELPEKETERLLTRNKKSEIEKHSQRTQTSLRRLQDVLKRPRRLTTKSDVVKTSGKRRLI